MNEPNIYLEVTLPDRRLEVMTGEKGERVFLGNLSDQSGYDLVGVRSIVDKAVVPLVDRVKELEQQIHDLENPPVGMDAAETIGSLIEFLKHEDCLGALVYLPNGNHLHKNLHGDLYAYDYGDRLSLSNPDGYYSPASVRSLILGLDKYDGALKLTLGGDGHCVPVIGYTVSPERERVFLQVGSPW